MIDPGDTGGGSSRSRSTGPGETREHPDPQLLHRFMRGDTDARESGRVVGHLLTGCSRCLGVTRSVWRLPRFGVRGGGPPPVVHPESYGTLGRSADRARRIAEELMDADRRRARSLCRELVSLPAAERLPVVCRQDRFRSFHLVRLLEQEVSRIHRRRPASALALAEVAVTVAERLDPGTFGESAVADLQAFAWGTLAACQRRRDDPSIAERSLAVAEALLRVGSGDPLERARLLYVKALLRRDRRRFENALALLDRAQAAHRELGDPHVLGLIHVERGRQQALLGRPADAVDSLGKGLELLDRQRDPWLAFEAGVERGHHLVALDRVPEALQQIRSCRAAGEAVDDSAVGPELARLEARVAAAAGRPERAEELLSGARLEWLAQEAGGSAVLATLDLANLYLETEVEKIRQLGEWARCVFPSPGMEMDDHLAVYFLGCAGEEPGEYGGLLRHITRHLERTRWQSR